MVACAIGFIEGLDALHTIVAVYMFIGWVGLSSRKIYVNEVF